MTIDYNLTYPISEGYLDSDIKDQMKKLRNAELKFIIDLLDVNNEQYVATIDGFDLIDEDIEHVIKIMDEWLLCLPHKEIIMDYIFSGFVDPSYNEDEIVEYWLDGDYENLETKVGLYGDDLAVISDLLEQTLKDFYIYTSHVLTMTKLIDTEMWQYFKCLSCEINSNKIYLTVSIYEDELKILGYEEPAKCMAVLDDISRIINQYERNLTLKKLLR